ncbi:hypothetical protein CR969_00100 [Candidatus Saccharibacteria bacterium]|nr:MAG: hypothetical protein CR969_00100 [Candidatus Saccharibacteria bacterium]
MNTEDATAQYLGGFMSGWPTWAIILAVIVIFLVAAFVVVAVYDPGYRLFSRQKKGNKRSGKK